MPRYFCHLKKQKYILICHWFSLLFEVMAHMLDMERYQEVLLRGPDAEQSGFFTGKTRHILGLGLGLGIEWDINTLYINLVTVINKKLLLSLPWTYLVFGEPRISVC